MAYRRMSSMSVLAGLIVGVSLPQTVLSQTARPETARPSVSSLQKQTAVQDDQAVVRLAHFSFVQGQVLFRTDSTGEWAAATVNMPLREGAQITTDQNARAEIQFDDGSTLRLTDSAVITLKSMYSDADGEFTELSMTDGTASMHVLSRYSVYQIDTADGDVKAAGPAKLRLDTADYLKAGVEDGTATLSNLNGDFKLQKGDLAEIKPDLQTPDIEDLPAPDDWDQFCDSRDSAMAPSDVFMPDDVALDAGRLSDYGTWQPDADYGNVWYPTDQSADWQPYLNGSWTWVQPLGWTWVSVEAWGWAPYHYGTWIFRKNHWGWVPGPKHQHWSPGLVWFTTVGAKIAWVPLAPCEVHYTSPHVAFKHGDWGRYFSIGGAGVYLAGGRDYVAVKSWTNAALNKVHPGDPNSPIAKRPDYEFVPHNSREGGTVEATLTAFQAGKGYHPLRTDSRALFAHGSSLLASGPAPANVRPTPSALSPTRRYQSNPLFASTQDRAVYVRHTASVVVNAGPSAPASQTGSRPHAEWSSPSAAQTAAARARKSIGYLSPTTSQPMFDTVVRHSTRPAAETGESDANQGYSGARSFRSRSRNWGGDERQRPVNEPRAGDEGERLPRERMRPQPPIDQNRQSPQRPAVPSQGRFEPPRQPSPPQRQAPPPPPQNKQKGHG